ncbi:MAG: glycogen debranching protein GlgX [Candidatus Nanopelagicales bacterium]
MYWSGEAPHTPSWDGPTSVARLTQSREAARAAAAWPGHWNPLGLSLHSGGVNAAIWAEGADLVELCLFDEHDVETRITLEESTFNVFHGFIPGVQAGDRYGFRVHGAWDPARGSRWNSAKLLIDPYARAIEGELVLHPAIHGHVGRDDLTRNDEDSAPYVPRCVVVDNDYDWGDDQHPFTPWVDTVIYETHVKGQTKLAPDIPEHLRGTYSGLAHPAAIEHFTKLGITAVELLPIHHFVSEEHVLAAGLSNYWGYQTIGFFAPHAAYSSTGTRGQQVTEFKDMVKALHSAGLEVILDVVYNHTGEGDQWGPTLSFRGIDNDGYYKLSNNGRSYADYTGCGNTPNIAQPHVVQLIMDSLRYWVSEMHVDGFRFDLASALARSFHDVDMLGTFMSAIQQDPLLRTVKLIAEPWDIGSGGYQVGSFPTLWTEWNDKYRDTIRDYWRGLAPLSDVGWRLTGSADLYWSQGRRPFASINFVTAHDGFTMRDLVSYDVKHNLANKENNRDGSDNNRSWNHGHEGETDDPDINALRHRQIRNYLTTLILSTGVPMITAGDEIGRTQGGNNNPYCQDNPISWVNWDLEPWQRDLFTFTAGLIGLRLRHPVFRRRFFFDGTAPEPGRPKDLAWLRRDGQEFTDADWHFSDSRMIGMYLSGELRRHRGAGGELLRDEPFLLLLNGSQHAGTFVLPHAPFGAKYQVVVDTVDGHAGDFGPIRVAGAELPMPSFSCKLLRIIAR